MEKLYQKRYLIDLLPYFRITEPGTEFFSPGLGYVEFDGITEYHGIEYLNFYVRNYADGVVLSDMDFVDISDPNQNLVLDRYGRSTQTCDSDRDCVIFISSDMPDWKPIINNEVSENLLTTGDFVKICDLPSETANDETRGVFIGILPDGLCRIRLLHGNYRDVSRDKLVK